MDPEAALVIARSALAAIRLGEESNLLEDLTGAQDDLADAFEALDQWLSNGGWLPTAWLPSLR